MRKFQLKAEAEEFRQLEVFSRAQRSAMTEISSRTPAFGMSNMKISTIRMLV
jgi:hypothetical protein